MIARATLAVFALMIAATATADVFRPAYLEIKETADNRFDVLWKVPGRGDGRRLSAYVSFPDHIERISEPVVMELDGAWIERYPIQSEKGLVGARIAIQGNAVNMTDVIARIEWIDGRSQVERLAPDQAEFVVQAPLSTGQIAWSYLVLGVEHILGGIDHLLFVLALLLVVRGSLRILATITAFTIAHSLTLAAATLGVLNVPGPPVEAIIALSIVFVASEVMHGQRGRPGLTARAPWVVAFSFGLLHGLGFAGALAEVGLPQVAIPVALLLFNVGVELGQLLFVAAILLLQQAVRRLPGPEPAVASTVTAYAIGSIAAFWTIERIVAF